MKKILMISTAIAALSTGAMANSDGGLWYVAGMAGWAQNSAQAETNDPSSAATGRFLGKQFGGTHAFKNTSRNSSVNTYVRIGHQRAISDTWVLATGISAGYNAGKVNLGTFSFDGAAVDGDTLTGAVKIDYHPNISVGTGIYLGRMIGEHLGAYAGLSAEVDFAKLKTHGTVSHTVAGAGAVSKDFTENSHAYVFSMTPIFGLAWMLSDKWTTVFEMGYKYGLFAQAHTKSLKWKFKKVPQSFTASVGVSYAFS